VTNSEVLDGVLLGRVSLENVNWNMGVRKMTDSGRVTRRFPPPWSVEEQPACFCRARSQRTGARLCLFRGRTGQAFGSQTAHQGRGAEDRGKYREAAGAVAQALALLVR
jgi:hypothetical protein